MADSGKQSLIQLGIENENGLVNQVHAESLAYARDRAAEMVGKKWVNGALVDNPNAEWVITDTTRDDIQALVAQVQSGELKATDLPGAIMEAATFSKERAAMIARTELMEANAQGSLASYYAARKIGVNVKKAWLPDAEACDICLENEAAGAIDLDDEFPSGDMAPTAHPNAVFSGSTFVPYGSLKRMISAKYNGLAVRLKAGDYHTTIGPNHPMLTDKGLVNAELLQVGDKLIYDTRAVNSSVLGKSDLDKMIITENAFSALKSAFGYSRIAPSSDDFHGDTDGLLDNEKVDVVFPERELLEEFDSFGLEKFRDGGFMWPDPDLPVESGNGASGHSLARILLPSSSGVSGVGIGHFVLVEIEKIEHTTFKGYAFDATTSTSLYCSDGFVVSNCECVLIPVTGDEIDNPD